MTENVSLIVDALRKTDNVLYQQIAGGGAWKSALTKRAARVGKYRRYERGDHDQNLTKQQRNLLNITADDSELNESSSNYCGIVVDMMAARIKVNEITSDSEEATAWITDTLERNSFVSKQGEWHRGAIRDSESYILIDPSTAMWTSEPAFDGHSGIVAIFDEMTQLPIWACKIWAISEPADLSTDAEDLGEETSVKVVVYQRSQITYWKGTAGSETLSPDTVKEVKGMNIIKDAEGNDLNGYDWKFGLIPLAQEANKRDNYTPYGESEIRVVIPLQDIVNGTLYDMQMASKLSAFKIYWSIGMEIDKDGIVPGSVVNMVLKDKSGNVVTMIDEDTARYMQSVRVGEFGVTDMSQYTNQLDKLEREISQVSQTPVYGITSQGNLSGEALKQLESGLIGKIVRFQNENTGALINLLKLTAEMQRQFQVNQDFLGKFADAVMKILGLSAPKAPPSELGAISVNWKSPEIINVNDQITALSTLRRDNPGLWPDDLYRERIGGLLGMTSVQIKDEGDKAVMESRNSFDMLIGGGGETPPVDRL